MAGYHRVERTSPLIPRHVNISVADTAMRDIEMNVVRAGFASLEGKRGYWGSGALGSVAFGRKHGDWWWVRCVKQ